MNRITLPYSLLLEAIASAFGTPSSAARLFAGTYQTGPDLELLAFASSFDSAAHLIISLSSDPERDMAHLAPALTGVRLMIGRDRSRGEFAGAFRIEGQIRRIDRLRIIGPGINELASVRDITDAAEPLDDPRHSRTIGALGRSNWLMLTRLSIAIIGLGRTGPIVADALHRLGVRNLTLIDPDRIEPHNLGEMAVIGAGDVGSPKPLAVARVLAGHDKASHDGVERAIRVVQRSITHIDALEATRQCDVLISTVDHDAARLATAAIGVLYHRPVLDIATGVLGENGRRQMGADIRLTLPGRCLVCVGGLRNPREAHKVLFSAEAEEAFNAARDWRRERAGSLASLNMLAASLALRLLEDWIAGRIEQTIWIHVEIDERGRADLRYPAFEWAAAPCALCQLSGHGDAGVHELRNALLSIAQ